MIENSIDLGSSPIVSNPSDFEIPMEFSLEPGVSVKGTAVINRNRKVKETINKTFNVRIPKKGGAIRATAMITEGHVTILFTFSFMTKAGTERKVEGNLTGKLYYNLKKTVETLYSSGNRFVY